MAGPRIALLGFMLEANEFAPVTTGADFRASCYLVGDEILAEAAKPAPAMPAEISGFIEEMDRAGPWQPVPIVVTNVEPGGPAEAAFVRETLATMRDMLLAAGPLDAVYLCNHGAMTATDSTDPDGAYYAMARQAVGPDVPVVATVDLHANISDRMVEASDAIISYHTNPHVDQAERAAEAARLIRWLLAGGRLTKTFIRMPIVAPSVRLLTAAGPYADLIRRGQAEKPASVRVVSVVGGFAWGDTPENGLAILTYGESKPEAEALARALAHQAWDDRERFRVTLTPLTDAIAAAKARGEDATLPALCIADVADNPGGGGRGNTTDVLEGLIAADVQGALLGLFIDPAAAAACHAAGVGAKIDVVFNRANADEHGRAVPARIEVLALSDGFIVGRRGIAAGRTSKLGPSACIRMGGITMVVASRRIQAADPAYFEAFGLDIAAFRTVVLKSRGHFRAGFDQFFDTAQIVEVDALGLTNPMLSRFPFRRLPRPVYPLDPDTRWQMD
ncbi:MAG: M81 family metallopeptidase [Alphaproteobacteria bacterium]|nr:M81 family metallopeptidase [Alphaproteobacteria bacterium]MCB9930215.1 M81 family metallopeptidase [Alphaproteobacteria bacterium]